ncbi:protein kinase [Kribbella sp. NPDC051952]|uniref:serine/threonine-protein kinase n=1 Tax=Kribbella sp. NPDC051952 TaxID=3154851 RepID=UPI00341A6DCB
MLVARRYRLGSFIGRGGMGEVFRATDEQLGRSVAVKVLLPTDHDARAAERFHREARAAARLNDPHVVSVYDFGPHGDGFFLVMELVEGRTVGDELAEHGSLSKDRAIDIVEQAAAGLAAAHREDVVHRDVKPGNLLVTEDGTVKVADFGIAHLPGDGASTLTATGQIIGSTHYLAPERARGGQSGKPADVYALGCVLYQLVTGQPPFTAEHPAAILYQHVDTAPELPSVSRPELGGVFESVLLQMLAKDAGDRPTAAEIAAGALRATSVGSDVGPTVPVGVVEASELPVGSGATGVAVGSEVPVGSEVSEVPVGSAVAERPAGSRRMVLLAAGIAILATAGAVLAVVLLNDNDKKLPPTTDVGPKTGVTSSTPGATQTSSSTTNPSQSRTTDPASPTTSAPTSTQASTPTPTATSPGTTSSSSAPPPSNTKSSVPTRETPSTSTSSSSTPTTSSSTPPASTPPPSTEPSDTPPPPKQ